MTTQEHRDYRSFRG